MKTHPAEALDPSHPEVDIRYIVHLSAWPYWQASAPLFARPGPPEIGRVKAMLNRLPSGTGSFEDLLSDLGLSARDTPRIARALGVSERTVWRWKKTNAPRMALLSLWWLSREGHSTWDCEMFNRTQLALAMNSSLWRHIGDLKRKPGTLEANTADLRHYGPAANEASARRLPK